MFDFGFDGLDSGLGRSSDDAPELNSVNDET